MTPAATYAAIRRLGEIEAALEAVQNAAPVMEQSIWTLIASAKVDAGIVRDQLEQVVVG
jgi:hypothetical protein